MIHTNGTMVALCAALASGCFLLDGTAEDSLATDTGDTTTEVVDPPIDSGTAVDSDVTDPLPSPSNYLFASVDEYGVLHHGNRVVSTVAVGAGQYEVTFDRDVSGCAYVATPHNLYSQALTVYTASGHASANGVYVETKNQGGGLIDGAFDLVVSCGEVELPFAVVDTAKNLVRSTPGTSLTASYGGGFYYVTFPRDVTTCSFIATVGDPADELVYSPAGVYVASGMVPAQVYVETKNPGGGLQNGVPFHLIAICPTASTRMAVVGGGGLVERASPGTTVTRSAVGEYDVRTDRSLADCAVVSTSGSVYIAVPYAPATVETVPGSLPEAFGLQVRSLLFFGGALTDGSTHSAAVCP